MVENCNIGQEHKPFADPNIERLFKKIITYDGGKKHGSGYSRQTYSVVVDSINRITPETTRFCSEIWSYFDPNLTSSDNGLGSNGLPYKTEIFFTRNENVKIAKTTWELQGGGEEIKYIFFNSSEEF